MCLIDYSLLSAHHSFMRQMCMKHPLCTRNGVPSYPPYIPGTGPCLSLLPPFRSQPPATPLCRPGPEDRGENSSQDCCEMQTGNLHERTFIAVVQSLSCVQLFATPWTLYIRGFLQARILEWVAFLSSRDSSQLRD